MKALTRPYNLLLIAGILIFSGCNQTQFPEIPQSTGLTILGLDGATWSVIDFLIDKGELPGFKRLKEEGSWGFLETFTPTESISLWTTIATGVSPSRHGVHTFTRRIPGTDQYVPSPSTDRQVPALWNMVSDKGKTVVSVKWFATWPAEQVNGAMLSPRLEAEDTDPRTYPLDLFNEIDPFRYQSIMDDFPQPPLPKQNPQMLLQQPIKALNSERNAPPILIGQSKVSSKMFDDTSVWLAGKYVYNKYSPDLFMLYLKSTDRVQHFLWGSHNENSVDPEKKAEAEAIYVWYRFYDDIILELLEDQTRTLMVVSDHGFHSLESVDDPYYIWDIDFDLILEFAGFLVRHGQKTAWPQTSAYTYRNMPYDKAVLFRLNMVGREPDGVVTQEAASSQLGDLAATLKQIQTMEGIKLFDDIQIFDEEATLFCKLTDTISLDDVIFLDNRLLKLRNIIIQKGLPRGLHTHAPPGIFVAHGPGIERGKTITGAKLFDITPTALRILGLPVAQDFDGHVIENIFSPGWKAIEYIPTYGSRQTIDELTVTDGDNRMLDELRALGYIQ
ncbi:MAG: alkaline phosphatase family protein [bacterium]